MPGWLASREWGRVGGGSVVRRIRTAKECQCPMKTPILIRVKPSPPGQTTSTSKRKSRSRPPIPTQTGPELRATHSGETGCTPGSRSRPTTSGPSLRRVRRSSQPDRLFPLGPPATLTGEGRPVDVVSRVARVSAAGHASTSRRAWPRGQGRTWPPRIPFQQNAPGSPRGSACRSQIPWSRVPSRITGSAK